MAQAKTNVERIDRPKYQLIEIGSITPSKTNPRKKFDEVYLQELANSIKEKGVLEPLIVRPVGAKFEIVAGECRYRASKLAEQTQLPCVIRSLTTEQALELQFIENLQRRDLTPLEEANGFKALIKTNPDKHNVSTIGARIGKSATWVWNVVHLLNLIPEAQKLLDDGRMSVNHAIPISRLSPDDQKKVIDPDNGGLFVGETRIHFDSDGDKNDPYLDTKPVTVRELVTWINDHIRFDPKQAAEAAPLEFEETAEKVEAAAAKPGRGKKVILITRDYHIQVSARGDERIFTSRAWKRADGTEKTTHAPNNHLVDSKTCDYSVMGVVAVGPGQGEVFDVCIAKDRCKVHWGTEIKEREKRSKAKDEVKDPKTGEKKRSQWEIDQERQRAEYQRQEDRFRVFGPAIKKAVYEKLSALKGKEISNALYVEVLKYLGVNQGTKRADFLTAVMRVCIDDTFKNAFRYNEAKMVGWAKALGVDVKSCEPKKEEPKEPKAAKKAPAKKASKKR